MNPDPVSGPHRAAPDADSPSANGGRVASHFVPRTRDGRIAIAAFVVLFLLAMPPVTHTLLDRGAPWLGGVPFLFTGLLVVYCALICVLVWALRRGV